MKNYLFIIAALISFNSFGQVWNQIYISTVERNLELLVGEKVYPADLSEGSQQYGYLDFYTSLDKKRHVNAKKTEYKSPYSPLNRTEFIVNSIIETYPKYMLELKNVATGELIYFEHSTLGSSSELALFEVPSGLYASQISVDKDRLEDKITYRTPYDEYVSFVKVVRGEESIIYLSLSTYGSTLNVLEKGATILFTDGTKLEFPDIEIRTKAHTRTNLSGYDYSIFTRLTEEEIEMFSTKTVEYFKLYVYDREINKNEGIKYNAYMNILR
jgi:hypothetical protein